MPQSSEKVDFLSKVEHTSNISRSISKYQVVVCTTTS